MEASLRVTKPDSTMVELFGRILPSTIAGIDGHTHYFSVIDDGDAYELADALATSSELRLAIFADLSFWGLDENSFARDSEFAVHTSGVVYPGLFDVYFAAIDSMPVPRILRNRIICHQRGC